MFHLNATINYENDEKDIDGSHGPLYSINEVNVVIRETLLRETTATSFVFTLVPVAS